MTLPIIRLSDKELISISLDPTTRLLAWQVFASKGVLVIENAFAPELIVSLKNAVMTNYAWHLVDQKTDETLKVGHKQILVPIEIDGVFNEPHLQANPFVFPIVQHILGAKCILRSFGAVIAFPGADDQHIHRDHPFLFQEEVVDTLMPAFAVNVIVPLVHINGRNGTTRVWPCSHRVWADDKAKQLTSEEAVAQAGSCILMDYRLFHQGTANHSERARPILYLTYHRPWFKDYVNPLHNAVGVAGGIATSPPGLPQRAPSAGECRL